VGGGNSTSKTSTIAVTRIVDFSVTFNLYYSSRYSDTTVDKIDDFIEHFELYGLFGNPAKGEPAWVGKVSPSWNLPASYVGEDKEHIISYAKQNKLWHAHIGDPEFTVTHHGKYQTSDWVIHFQKINDNHIKLLELGYHNPMSLPTKEIIDEKT